MTITVEDGTEVANANSYASVGDLYDYATLRDVTLCDDVAVVEALLIKAMDYIRREYSQKWQGERTTSTQSLDWPRENVWINGSLVDNDTIPADLVYGQLAAAVEIHTGDTTPAQGPIRREKIGDMELEYENHGTVYQINAYANADAHLRVLCKTGGLFVVRA